MKQQQRSPGHAHLHLPPAPIGRYQLPIALLDQSGAVQP